MGRSLERGVLEGTEKGVESGEKNGQVLHDAPGAGHVGRGKDGTTT